MIVVVYSLPRELPYYCSSGFASGNLPGASGLQGFCLYCFPRRYRCFPLLFPSARGSGKTNISTSRREKSSQTLNTGCQELQTPGVALWSAKGVSLPGPFRLPSVFLPFIPCLSIEICNGNLKADFQTAGGQSDFGMRWLVWEMIRFRGPWMCGQILQTTIYWNSEKYNLQRVRH